MRPVLFEIAFAGVVRPVGGYGVAVVLGMLLTGILTVRAASRARQDVGAVAAVCGYTVGAGLVGAWLAHLAVEWARTGTASHALASGGGLVFYGAVPTGALAAWLGARGLGVSFAKMVDLAVPGIAAGHALGRMGCFFGGCCFGAPTTGPFAVAFTHPLAPAAHPPVPRHPVQLYEAAGLLLLAMAFAVVPIRRADGRRALGYVIAYGALRFVTEMLRGDASRGLWGVLSTSQIVAIVFASAAALVLGRLRARGLGADAAPR